MYSIFIICIVCIRTIKKEFFLFKTLFKSLKSSVCQTKYCLKMEKRVWVEMSRAFYLKLQAVCIDFYLPFKTTVFISCRFRIPLFADE
jgi:hypothetical protein